MAQRRRTRTSLILLCAFGTALVANAAEAKGTKVVKATFAKDVTKDFKAKQPGSKFAGTETVFLLLEFSGRPKKGVVESIFNFRGEEIARTNVNFETVNDGLLFSFGANTFVKFFFKPDPKNPLPIGEFIVDVTVDKAKVGSYPFSIVPPAGAIATKIASAKIARKVDENNAVIEPGTVFAPADTVYLAFTGDYGKGSWLEAQWTVGGKVDPNGTRSITLKENAKGQPGSFSFVPSGGWPIGAHSVELTVNAKSIGKYAFTVK